jgi:putative membrane protein
MYGRTSMWLLLLILIGLVVYLIVRIQKRGVHIGEEPLDIAKERYARGEITREEFEEMKRELK